MAKPNTYVLLKNAEKEILRLRYDIEFMKGFTLRQCLDMTMIALNEEFNFGPERNKRFESVFWQTFLEYAEMCVEDGQDDKEIAYTKGKLDRRLRIACGEDYPEFDDRYAEKNLYRRCQLETKEEV